MVIFDSDKCIGCGMCARDCLPRAIVIEDGKARFIEDHNCMECGHCVAICPRNAVTITGLDSSEVLELKDISYKIDPDVYLAHLKATRSIRAFKDEPVSEEQLRMIIDAGRFSPTGGNKQNVAYHVFEKNIGSFRDLVMHELKHMGDEATEEEMRGSWYPDLWLDMYDDFIDNGVDRLFFDAGTVIVVSSDSPQAATIASAHMETMVYALGLGMLYSGFTVRAVNHSEEIQKFLRLEDGYNVWTVLVIGHPKPTYRRTVSRKPAKVTRD